MINMDSIIYNSVIKIIADNEHLKIDDLSEVVSKYSFIGNTSIKQFISDLKGTIGEKDHKKKKVKFKGVFPKSSDDIPKNNVINISQLSLFDKKNEINNRCRQFSSFNDRRDAIIEIIKDKWMSAVEISKATGVSLSYVYRIMKRDDFEKKAVNNNKSRAPFISYYKYKND